MMLLKKDKRKNKRQLKKLNSNLTKQSIKPNWIDLRQLLPNRKLKMQRILTEQKRDLRLMPRELRLKTGKEKLRREREELKRLLNKLKSRQESKSKESPLRKLKRN